MSKAFEVQDNLKDKPADQTAETLRQSSGEKPPQIPVAIAARAMEEGKRLKYPSEPEQDADLKKKYERTTLREQDFSPLSQSTIDTSLKSFAKRMDNDKLNLSAEQANQVREVEQAVLTGNLKSLQSQLKSGEPANAVKDTIAKDLQTIDMSLQWTRENMYITSEYGTAYANFGLNIPKEGQPSAALSNIKVRMPKIGEKSTHLDPDSPIIVVDSAAAARDIAISANARLLPKKSN